MQMVEAPNSCQFVAVHINLPEMSYLLQLLSIMDDRKRSRGGAKRFERVQEKLRNATMRHRSLTKRQECSSKTMRHSSAPHSC